MSHADNAGPADPLRAWREWFVKSEREWSETLTRQMQQDPNARAVGQEINAALYAQQMIKQGMSGPLASMNLPTQDQLQALGERLGQLEDAVARIEASLGQLRHFLGAATVAEPRRDRVAPPAVAKAETADREVPNVAKAAKSPKPPTSRTASPAPAKAARPARKRRS